MAKELLNDSASESSDSEQGGASIEPSFKVNQEFAKRFEYNKKREELAKLEEKHGKDVSRKRKRPTDDDAGSESESSSSEDEDDVGELATEALDAQIFATLNALKSKDPRVYDSATTFYTEIDGDGQPQKVKKEKPVFLRDYHRENLLNGVENGDGEEENQPLTYNQEQDQLKKSVLHEIQAAAAGADEDESDSYSEGGLLVRKNKSEQPKKLKAPVINVEEADRDPETFLSNFMAARAWVPTEDAAYAPLESDDSDEEKRAEEFEEAYNMRFEDPEKSNEKLNTFSRAVAAKYSVRREEKNSRKKKREAEKAAKDAAKQELKEEKARLKKLRMEEVEEKTRRIMKAAGLKARDLQPEDWSRFIDEDWDDARWEEEMQKRFNDQYYNERDDLSAEDNEDDEDADSDKKGRKKQKPKKPVFDDDIDIKDIVPDFEDEEEAAANFSLTEDDDEDAVADDEAATTINRSNKKSLKQAKADRKKESRKQRALVEQLVGDQLKMDLDHAITSSAPSRSKTAGFRYRETSPQTFGLTNRDILLADESALNQFAGLKKLAAWRDQEKKAKDKKKLGKKARLRKWRLDTFGDEEGVELKELVYAHAKNGGGQRANANSDDEEGGVDIRGEEGSRKKKGRRRKKAKVAEVVV